MPSRFAVIVAILVFVLAALGIAAYVVIDLRGRPVATSGGEGSLTAAPIGGPFTLTDHTGRRVTAADYADRYLLVSFGYTWCPDICPTTLNTVALTMQALGDKAGRVQPLLITIDPERDTPAVLAEYVALFDAGIVGLTGSPDEIASVARAYRVHYRKAPVEGDPDNYLMDHSTVLYLMAPGGGFLGIFDHDDPPDAIAAEIAAHIDADS